MTIRGVALDLRFPIAAMLLPRNALRRYSAKVGSKKHAGGSDMDADHIISTMFGLKKKTASMPTSAPRTASQASTSRGYAVTGDCLIKGELESSALSITRINPRKTLKLI